MKKLLLALSLAAAMLFSTTSCDIDVNITVSAYAELIDTGLEITPTQTFSFGPFSHYYLSEAEINDIFIVLIKSTNKDFTTADLFLQYTDNITRRELKIEHYGVVVDGTTGRYVYELMDY